MLVRWDIWLVDQVYDVPSKNFFMISCKILCKNPFNLFSYFFYKIKIKSFECPKSIKSIKKIILGTTDAWLTTRLSHRPNNPAYYIVNWRISWYPTPPLRLMQLQNGFDSVIGLLLCENVTIENSDLLTSYRACQINRPKY